MATTADFNTGMVIEFDDDLYQIVNFQHVKPGKGQAFVRTELKSLTTGKVQKHKFKAGEEVEAAIVDDRQYQFLYKDETGFHFMDQETFEQTVLQEEMINNPALLKEGQEVTISIHEETGKPVQCELPPFVELEITYTEPGVKGDTATNTLKSATVETGTEIQVPLFIEQDEKIKVDTRTNEYVERVKS